MSDGNYGLAAFDLVRDGLTARKSWFFFDDEYACLGAGITCGSDNLVATTINQCNLVGDVLVASDDQGASTTGPTWYFATDHAHYYTRCP